MMHLFRCEGCHAVFAKTDADLGEWGPPPCPILVFQRDGSGIVRCHGLLDRIDAASITAEFVRAFNPSIDG